MLEWSAGQVISSALPFMVMTAVPQTVNKTRVIEAIVIASISGAFIAFVGMYVALPVLMEKIDNIRRDIARVEQTVKDDRVDSNMVIEKLKADISQIKVDQARGR
jgi:hypothetical protein